jgi:hypothetical protein
MTAEKKMTSILAVGLMAGVLLGAGGCNFSEFIVSSVAGSLTGSSSLTGATSISVPTSTVGNSMIPPASGTGAITSGGILPSAQPSPTLQQLLSGPVVGP